MTDIRSATQGRWRDILTALGVAQRFLHNSHGPCPMCGGKDRWRFDDKGGHGTWICSQCGAGDGMALVRKLKGLDYLDATHLIEPLIGNARQVAPKVSSSEDRNRDAMAALWRASRPLTGDDPVARYLIGRGIAMTAWPHELRYAAEVPYWADNERGGGKTKIGVFPCLVSRMTAPDLSRCILHRTFLDDQMGFKVIKADVPSPKRMMPGKTPLGGAVRLFPVAEELGIAEGIETALSAALLFGIPVWATLTARNMMNWQPPAEVRRIVIFGDRDVSWTGQMASSYLAYKLKARKREVEVKWPDAEGMDWNDLVAASYGSIGASLAAGAAPVGVLHHPR